MVANLVRQQPSVLRPCFAEMPGQPSSDYGMKDQELTSPLPSCSTLSELCSAINQIPAPSASLQTCVALPPSLPTRARSCPCFLLFRKPQYRGDRDHKAFLTPLRDHMGRRDAIWPALKVRGNWANRGSLEASRVRFLPSTIPLRTRMIAGCCFLFAHLCSNCHVPRLI